MQKHSYSSVIEILSIRNDDETVEMILQYHKDENKSYERLSIIQYELLKIMPQALNKK